MKKGDKHTEETKAKMSEAKEGNSNAEKWTEETVMPILSDFEELLSLDLESEYITLTDLLITKKLHKDIWADWRNKFKENEIVCRTIKRIDDILENRLFNGALKGKYNATMAIFGLKNNYKWTDKKEIDHMTGGEPFKIVEIRNYAANNNADKGN